MVYCRRSTLVKKVLLLQINPRTTQRDATWAPERPERPSAPRPWSRAPGGVSSRVVPSPSFTPYTAHGPARARVGGSHRGFQVSYNVFVKE